MDQDNALALRRALDYLRDGNTAAARPILVEILRTDPDVEQAWYMLSYVLPSTERQVYALEQVLRINPNHEKARTRLAKITTSEEFRPPPPLNPDPFVAGRTDQFEKIPSEDRDLEEEAFGAVPIPDWARSTGQSQESETELKGIAESIDPSSSEEVGADDLLSARLWGPAGDDAEKPEKKASEPRSSEKGAIQAPPFESGASSSETAEPEAVFDASSFVGEPEKPRRGRRVLRFVLLSLAGIVLGFIFFGVYLFARDNLSLPGLGGGGEAGAPSETPTPTTESGLRPLPPTWTPTASPSPTPTLPPTATPTGTATPTPLPLPSDTLSEIERIQQQVSDLRGFPVQGSVNNYVISRYQVQDILEDFYLTESVVSELEDEARVLVALGLIKPTYDLVSYTLNSRADNIGGFYLPEVDHVYVIGAGFTGLEKYIYSHEFAHALVDQQYDLASLGVFPECQWAAQRCKAIQALVEGDATLIELQWFFQYAGPNDYQAIFNYNPPPQLLPDDFPPPYISRDLSFPYIEGFAFVEALYERGNWAEVNRAWDDLPSTTEHILHPQKYLNGEQESVVADPDLAETLGDGWRLLEQDSLGEWTTFLLLGYGADNAAQIPEADAIQASEGWGGDHYQVYYHDGSDAIIVAAHWAWDTRTDADEFWDAFGIYQDARFRGASISEPAQNCWSVGGQVSCILRRGSETLWVLAPDEASMSQVLGLFPNFS